MGEVLEKALGLPVGERQAFVDHECAADPALHEEVTSLLAHTGAGDRLFSTLGAAIGNHTVGAGELGAEKTIGRYRLGERLGGGVTSVYRALDVRTGETVALKLARTGAGNMSAADIDNRMSLEARVLDQLSHPAVCRLRGAGIAEDGRRYLVLEFIEGEPLHRRTAVRPLGAVDLARGAAHVGGALHEAHALRIVHRDLKPANIMVAPTNTLRILDFGAAKTDEFDLTAPGHTIGTLEYMAPEQLKGERVGPTTDVWSLALVLCEALLGSHPFRGETRRETLAAMAESDPCLPQREVDGPAARALLDLLRAGLDRRPERRPTAAEFAARATHIAKIAEPTGHRRS